MDKLDKEAFQKLLTNIVKDKSVYKFHSVSTVRAFTADGEKLTVMGLEAISSNHRIDDQPEEWGVTRIESLRVRAYFQTYASESLYELYKLFGNFFEGENKEYLENRYAPHATTFWKSLKLKRIPTFEFP